MIAATPTPNPTAIVIWAHSSKDWTPEEKKAWADEFKAFCIMLRLEGIDVDADFAHAHEPGISWDHYGPQQIDERGFTIVAVSPPWKERWEGRNDPTEGAGAAAEANHLHGLFNKDQEAFRNKVVLVELPSMLKADAVPQTLSGIQRFSITEISVKGVEDLIRYLTGQPRDVLPPVGQIPVLPPSSYMPSAPTTPAGQPMTKEDQEALAETNEQIGALRAAMKTIPEPEPWDGPHLPWYRSWHRVNNELSYLEQRRDALMKGPVEIVDSELPAVAAGSATSVEPLPPVPNFRQLVDSAPKTPGAPNHWMLYDGMTLMRVIMAAVPAGLRHPDGADLSAALARGAEGMAQLATTWRPNAPTLFLDDTAGDWATPRAHIWEAGMSSASAATLQSRPTAAAAINTQGPILAFDRTWNTKVDRDPGVGGGYYFAAFEPAIAVEIASALVFGGTVLGEFRGINAIDVSVQISAATEGAEGLTPADAYVSANDPHGTPSPRITPIGPLASKHFIDAGRFTLDDLRRQPVETTRAILGPWLVVFRTRDVFENV